MSRPAAPKKKASKAESKLHGDCSERGNFFLFWRGWPSQWYGSEFVLRSAYDPSREGDFTCAEQFMMAEKALLFGDHEAYDQIMKESSPRKMKQLGRMLRNFDADRWAAECERIVTRGSLAKFAQNPDLRALLLGTGDKIIVEASPLDTIWGIGLGPDHPDAVHPGRWRGQNLLGKCLMCARSLLRDGKVDLDSEDPTDQKTPTPPSAASLPSSSSSSSSAAASSSSAAGASASSRSVADSSGFVTKRRRAGAAALGTKRG